MGNNIQSCFLCDMGLCIFLFNRNTNKLNAHDKSSANVHYAVHLLNPATETWERGPYSTLNFTLCIFSKSGDETFHIKTHSRSFN